MQELWRRNLSIVANFAHFHVFFDRELKYTILSIEMIERMVLYTEMHVIQNSEEN